jgi:DNA replication protein DnaC
MITEQTLHHLGELKLWGMKQAFQQQLDQPQTYDLSFEERLGLLVDYEKTYRQNKKVERLLASARLRFNSCIEDIDYHQVRGFKREQLSHLASCRWIQENFNLMITGPTGIGKSWIACALGHQACRLGLSVFYIRLSKLLEEMRLAHVDLLIIDDWGLERFNVDQRRAFLDIVEERHNLKALLITSQLPTQTWHDVIGDPTIADAIIDRLLSKTFKLELEGESMRKAKKRDGK